MFICRVASTLRGQAPGGVCANLYNGGVQVIAPPARARIIPQVFDILEKVIAAVRLDTAKVAELVDALDLGSSGATRESSSLSFRTN